MGSLTRIRTSDGQSPNPGGSPSKTAKIFEESGWSSFSEIEDNEREFNINFCPYLRETTSNCVKCNFPHSMWEIRRLMSLKEFQCRGCCEVFTPAFSV